ncbi:hypothetical protein ACVWWR_005869 [Bradyrhizobium sp. LM3.2]
MRRRNGWKPVSSVRPALVFFDWLLRPWRFAPVQNARPAPGQHDATHLVLLLLDHVERICETAQHVHGDRVHHLLMVELEDRDRTIEIERDVFELHGFLVRCGLCQFRRPELLAGAHI